MAVEVEQNETKLIESPPASYPTNLAPVDTYSSSPTLTTVSNSSFSKRIDVPIPSQTQRRIRPPPLHFDGSSMRAAGSATKNSLDWKVGIDEIAQRVDGIGRPLDRTDYIRDIQSDSGFNNNSRQGLELSNSQQAAASISQPFTSTVETRPTYYAQPVDGGFSRLPLGSEETDYTNSTTEPISPHSTSNNSTYPRNYPGLQLGLPFSMSVADSLSSFSSALQREPSVDELLAMDMEAQNRSRSNSLLESPVTDRSKLIGLGELATPRWTSAALERRWGSPDMPTRLDITEELDSEVLRSYQLPISTPNLPSSSSSSSLDQAPDNSVGGATFLNQFINSQPPPSQTTHPLHPSNLFPSVELAGTTHVRTVSLRQHRLDSIAKAAHESAPPSPTYSLDAVSVEDDGQEVLRSSQVADGKIPRRIRSLAGSTSRASLGSGVGLGLDYENGRDSSALTLASNTLLENSKRISSGSITSASSRRSSMGRTASSEGKSLHSRRASASKSGFSHLPPSPHTSTNPRATSQLPPPPPSDSLALPSPPTSSTPMGQSQSQPNSAGLSKTPDPSRHSVHTYPSSHSGHQSSPSLIAASILRQTRDLQYDEMNNAIDTGAAEALRRLDGLGTAASPRLSKSYTSSIASVSRSRTNSRDTASPSRLSSKEQERKKARGSLGGDSPVISNSSNTSPALIATASFTSISSPVPASKSPLPPLPNKLIETRPTSSTSEVPFPSASPFKRVSSVSTSTATSVSTAGSRESTSGTSLSSLNVNRSTASSKNRRGSAGSDASSIHSAGEASIVRTDQMESREGEALVIPPVPPIPKDYEAYRPSTGGTSSSSATNSPRFGPVRRPSESSLADSLLNPKSPDMEGSSGGSSQGKTPPRKWSISGAFGKSKSPKLPLEAPFPSDLSSSTSSLRPRVTSLSANLADPWYPRRLAGSTNDIAGLSQGSSSPSGLGAKVRQSLRSDKPFSSALPRTRTSSMSSTNTLTKTLIPPALVATSPGRSRSSLLSPRQRTPSGIPFFSRKSSSSNISELAEAPNSRSKSVEKPGSSPEGRRSILGLNFLRSTASRREKEKSSPSPVLKRSIGAGEAGEFGTRPNLVTKASSLVTRKRGKTVNGPEDNSPPAARPSNLPPSQISAFNASTLKRIDSISSSASATSLSARGQVTPNKMSTPSRSLRLESSTKANLPTIAGSPSSNPLPPASRRSSNLEELPKPGTPTKIPRLQYRTDGISPALTPKPPIDVFLDPVATHRRASYFGATPETTSVPVESTEFVVATREPGLALGEKTLSTRRRQQSGDSQIPRSRSTATISSASIRASDAVSRDGTSSAGSSRAATALPRSFGRGALVPDDGKATISTSSTNTPRLSNTPLRVSASASTSRISSIATETGSVSRRVPAKVLETPIRRVSNLATSSEVISSARSSRLSASATTSKILPPARVSRTNTPSMSPAPTLSDSSRSVSAASSHHVTEEELRGDEEMSAYVRRQQTKKMAAGMSSDSIRKMFDFPEDTLPLPALDTRDAASLYSRYLTDYEKEEIRDHSTVYFVGNKVLKQPASKEVPLNNFGYDDERGDYLLVPHDHILYRYEVIDVLGKGSFGQVLQCRDHKTGEMVAIKIIRNKKRFHHQALVEIKVLENLVKWDPEEKHFVIRMVDSFTFRSHLCIVTELLSINLYELVKANSFVGFSTTLIKRFTVQILGSLSLLRHHRVVHCDLKPENILLKHPAKSAIKVIDFGSSCFEHEKVYTYIQSRFYRSPEVILGMNYHMAIDMWSLGCILAEMFTGYPIFPGENEQEQLSCIMEVLGLPDKYLVDRSSRKKLFFDSTGAPRPVTNSKGRRRRPGAKTLAQILKSEDELFVDFIAKCLTWDPDRRLKPDPAMRHPWITQFRTKAPATTVPSRISRASLGPSTTSSSASSTISLAQISTPRRKIAPSSSTTNSLRGRTTSTIASERYSVTNS